MEQPEDNYSFLQMESLNSYNDLLNIQQQVPDLYLEFHALQIRQMNICIAFPLIHQF